jgi:hypothetical protein
MVILSEYVMCEPANMHTHNESVIRVREEGLRHEVTVDDSLTPQMPSYIQTYVHRRTHKKHRYTRKEER